MYKKQNYRINGVPLEDLNILITGGAGVIGSSMSNFLSEISNISILDNLSSSSVKNIENIVTKKNVRFIKGDIRNIETVMEVMKDVDLVIHLAANGDVRYSENQGTDLDLKISTIGTYNVLEAMRKQDVKKLLYASSSSVYGEAREIPTSENYGPLLPESLYAASKIASESLISSFSYMFDLNSIIFRFANITAPIYRSLGRNVIPDFIFKLHKHPDELEILGDGQQEKSYLYVDDCIDGMFSLASKTNSPVDIFNLGNIDSTKVVTIAEIIIEEMELLNVRLKFTGGTTGWKGDVSKTILDIRKALSLGWSPSLRSDAAVRNSAKKIIANLEKIQEES